MIRKKLPCKHHPESIAVRRCFQCKDYICNICQIKRFHHIFCSYRCIALYLITEKFLKKGKYRDYAFLLLIMILIQIVTLSLFSTPTQYQRTYSSETVPNDSLNNLLNTHRFTLDTLFSKSKQSIKISGKAPSNTLIGLWNNGKYLTATVANRNRYNFPSQALVIGKNNFVLWGLTEDGITTLVDSLTIEYSSYRVSALAVPLNRLKTDKKILSLTFDGGSMANGTDSILTILAERNVRTTFFLTGTFINNYPDLVHNMLNDKHELANHTFTHPHLTSYRENYLHKTLPKVDRQFIIQELIKTDSLLSDAFGHHFSPFWRAPFGEYNNEILLWAAEAGYKHIGWSREGDTRDWVNDQDSPLYRTAEDIYQHVVEMESDDKLKGAILLMHLHSDRHSDMPYRILTKLIDYLRNKGYSLVTISELINGVSSLKPNI